MPNRIIPFSLRFKMFFVGNYQFTQVFLIFFIVFSTISLLSFRSEWKMQLIFGILALLFLLFLVNSWIKAYRQIRVLKNSKLGRARYVSSEPTMFRVGYTNIKRHTYSYYGDDNNLYKAYMDSTDSEPPLMVDLVYDSDEQNSAVILSGLPGNPTLQEGGHLSPVKYIGSLLIYLVFIYLFFIQ
ncbi:hypothetical protein [Paenibacillus glycanilyticus]|uniref:DUF3592 domain-containing protein n=1 Tax=Paenibacillus glycanilyticus TaxID=126569 RepID=A0ABQ6GJV3_9BACL|nr:hypothetical protein [Paenibacillus glycanilyticus]GLX71221.1 hypothetical protein MU1_55700 [Paenibacillus glycanilyticus]